MDRLVQLESHKDQLATAVKSLIDYRRGIDSSHQLSGAEEELNRAQANILASVAAIKILIGGPSDFLQHLASQVEILACLQWFAEFQILLFIPLEESSVSIKDVADLAGVPESQLCRVIRMTATWGFLQEPKKDLVAHTVLSAHFLANPSLLDASVFIAESAAPTAFKMPSATQLSSQGTFTEGSACNLALNTMRPFHTARQERNKLGRQWSAYLSHAAGLHHEEEVVNVVSRLNWSNLGNACIVEVGAQSISMARCLAKRFPRLRIVVQINNTQTWDSDTQLDSEIDLSSSSGSSSDSNSSITVATRTAGMSQPVKDATAYILHLPAISSKSPGGIRGLTVRAELQEYLGVLHASGGIMLILTTRLLPEPGCSNPEVEAAARARDLNMLQLANEGEMELAELLSIIETVQDNAGKLVVTDQLRSYNSLIIGLVVECKSF